jgi:hypothetical protein
MVDGGQNRSNSRLLIGFGGLATAIGHRHRETAKYQRDQCSHSGYLAPRKMMSGPGP